LIDSGDFRLEKRGEHLRATVCASDHTIGAWSFFRRLKTRQRKKARTKKRERRNETRERREERKERR
jgi:hypothetical protein